MVAAAMTTSGADDEYGGDARYDDGYDDAEYDADWYDDAEYGADDGWIDENGATARGVRRHDGQGGDLVDEDEYDHGFDTTSDDDVADDDPEAGDLDIDVSREQDDMGTQARSGRLRSGRPAVRERESTLDEIESSPRGIDRGGRVDSRAETTGGNMDLMAARESDATTAGGSNGDAATRRRRAESGPRAGASGSGRGGNEVIRLAETDEEESLFSVEPARRWVGYVLAAAKRHLIVFLLVFAVGGSLIGMFLASSPPLYQTASTILLTGDDGLGATDGSTSNARQQAAEIVLRRDSVDRYIDELGLAENLPEKPFFGRLQESVFGEVTGEALRDQLRDQLRLGLFATSSGDASIVITVLWPDPDQAVAIANMAYDVFREDRMRIEVEPAERRVEILTSRVVQASTNAENIRDRLRLSPDDGVPLGSALDTAVETEQDLIAELNVAEIALEEARAGVPLRYQLSGAPELPRVPLSNPMVFYVATLIAAAIMAFGATFWLERPKGRVMAPWQIERYGRTIVTTAPLDED